MTEHHHEVKEKIKAAYDWAKKKVITDGESMTPELAIILMLGYHILCDYKKEHIEEDRPHYHDGVLTEEEAKERVHRAKDKYHHEGRLYSEQDVKGVITSYPQFKEYPFWEVYFMLNYALISMYDASFPDKIYFKTAMRMLERMDNIKHFAYSI